MKDGGVAGKLAVVIAIWHYDSLRPGSQVISAKRRGSCCIKFLVACTKVCYTFAPAYINYTPGQRAKLLSATTPAAAATTTTTRGAETKKLIAYLQASKLPQQHQQTNRKLISSLTKFSFFFGAAFPLHLFPFALPISFSSHLSSRTCRTGLAFMLMYHKKLLKNF